MNRNPALALIVAAIFISAALCLDRSSASVTASAAANTLTVTNTSDSGHGSLRQALLDANDGDTITFNIPGETTVSTISLISGELAINKNVTISGPGAGLLAISRAQVASDFRIFHVTASHSVTIEEVTISNGTATNSGQGGGIFVDAGATLSLTSATVAGNSTSGTGAGLSSAGTMTIESSTVRDNNAGDYGGGIENNGTATIDNSTVSGNNGEFAAGAILNNGSLAMSNSTISGNTTTLHGGGLGNCCSENSHAIVNNCTFSGNSGSNGGAIYNRLGSLELKSTILKSGSTGVNINNDTATFTSLGFNVSDDNGAGFLTASGDQINTDPLLGPLQNNGGLTLTHALLPGSPAMNAGDPNFTPPPFFDQRGPAFDRVVADRIDIGSFEVAGSPTPTPTPTPSSTPSLSPLPTPSPPCLGGSAFWSHFSNTEPIAPADRLSNDPGTPPGLPTNYPSIVHVTGIIPPITDNPNTCWLVGMAVTFTLTSERPDDLDILLVAPNGSRSIIISDAGGNGPITNSGYLFRSHYLAGFPFFPDEVTPPPGYYGEANYIGLPGPEPDGMDNFPDAGGLANYPADLNQLLGAGYSWPADWRLYVVDDETGNISSLPQGWRLSFLWECSPCATPVPTPTPPAPTPTPTPSPTPTTPTPSPTPTVFGSPTPNPAVIFDSFPSSCCSVRVNGTTYTVPRFLQLPPGTYQIGTTSPQIGPAGIRYIWNRWNDGGPMAHNIRLDPGGLYWFFAYFATSRPAYDNDGDRVSDISVFRPSDGVWYLQQSQNGFAATSFGVATDRIAPADFDGDGKTDLAVYRPSTGTWYWLNSSDGAFRSAQFGVSEDLPVPADYDGDDHADISVFRPSNGTWYRLNSSDGSFYGAQFGLSEDKPTLGDYDGDGRADIAVFRPSNGAWYRLNSSDGQFVAVGFGLSTDLTTPADFDGDGQTDIAVYRPSTGTWYSLNSSNGAFVATQFGSTEDIPSAADYDGDLKADVCVFRPSDGVWYRLNSSNGAFVAVQFGINGDRPTPAAFRY